MNESTVAVTTSEDMGLLSGSHLLDVQTIVAILENPFGYLYDESIRC